MNLIVRIILRGLLSGEIQPEPQVFEFLRQVSEGRFQRQRRIQRFGPPSGPGVCSTRNQPVVERQAGGGPASIERSRERRLSPESSARLRTSPVFARALLDRWIRVAVCLLLGSVGLTRADVSVSGDAAAAIGSLSNLIHPFPQFLLIGSGALLGGLLLWGGWRWFCCHHLFVMRPHEVALQELEAIQLRMDQGRETNYPAAVLGVLRNYVEAQFCLPITERKRGALFDVLTTSQRWLLQEVMATGADTSISGSPPSSVLSDQARCFIWSTACCRVRNAGRGM